MGVAGGNIMRGVAGGNIMSGSGRTKYKLDLK